MDGAGDMVAAVMRGAGISQEDVTRCDAAAVGAHVARRWCERLQHGNQVRCRAHIASGITGASPGGALLLSNGASGGNAMKRSAPAITFENTGAAIRPP